LSGAWGRFEERQAVAAIHRAREAGVNLFDTARAYGWGASERLLGKALARELRESRGSVVLATKGGLRHTRAGVERDSSGASLRKDVEDSLSALGVDFIDLYQVHFPDPRVPIAETAEAVAQLVEDGKIRHVGVSNFDPDQIAEFSSVCPVETLQPPYNLFSRDIERDLLPCARERDIGVLVYGPLAHGLLAGAFDASTQFAADDWRSESPAFQGDAFHRTLTVVRELGRFAAERNHTVGQVAVAWVLAHPAVQVAIVGARDPAHFEDALGALTVELNADDRRHVERVASGALPFRI
jgi:aryl-alcohol dehydrogenase-like predicted oxidoreductase